MTRRDGVVQASVQHTKVLVLIEALTDRQLGDNGTCRLTVDDLRHGDLLQQQVVPV